MILSRCFVWIMLGLLVPRLWAGGSGFNVVIVVNQNSTNSIQLGNYYRQLRNVPPQNFLRINWSGTNTEWTLSDYTNVLLNPFLTMLSSRQLTNQVDYVVLSMDIPYRIDGGTNHYNTTTSALFYGFRPDPNWINTSCNLAANSSNLFAGAESIFHSTPPNSSSVPGSNSFIATMITANVLADAELAVAQGASSDATFPAQTTWLAKSSDVDRNQRYTAFDNAIFNSRLRGNYSLQRTNLDLDYFPTTIMGLATGLTYYYLSPIPLFVPGAMADSLTSFGGQLFENSGQTSLIPFLTAGASGSYGTVEEPCVYLEKFPDPQNYFYQARGFSLGECYYQSVTNPYQGLIVGEPLAAPFAQRGTGSWNSLSNNASVSGTTNLSFQFSASDYLHPLQQADLYLDGLWLQTITNIAPQSSNTLKVVLNGFTATYSVPSGATIKSVTSNLVAVLNGASYQAQTKVAAYAHGDRIELRSIAGYTKLGSQISLSTSSTNASAVLNTFINPSATNPTNFLDTLASGINYYDLVGSVAVNARISVSVTKTNGTIVSVSVTNTTSGATFGAFLQQFVTAINGTSALQGSDGLSGGDIVDVGSEAEFSLQANSLGYAAAQIKATVTVSSGITLSLTGANTLMENVADLEPRNHLYITTGVTNLSLSIPLNTTNFSDGYHELAAVAYEGSHVHTQTRATQNLIFKNRSLSATFNATLTGSNSALQPALQFYVAANATNISTIQLFSTGGLLYAATNQPSAGFFINLTNLNIGMHPFYALITDAAGHQYRTQTQTIGLMGVDDSGTSLIGVDYPFMISYSAKPLTLTWPATAGRTYNILSTTNLQIPFTSHATVIPNSALGQWTETNSSPAQQFYRISVSP